MSFFRNDDQIIHVLKQCFSKGDKFRIVENIANKEHPHYVSNIIHLTFEYEEDGIPRRNSLVLKVPTDDNVGFLADDLNFFNRESFMYDTIIPLLHNYTDEPLTPFYIQTADPRIIVLENLTTQGYTHKAGENKRLLYGQTQSQAIIKVLAHFHAASHKVAQLEPHLLQNKAFRNHSVLLEVRQKMANFWEPILIELLTRSNEFNLIPKFKNALLPLKKDDNDILSKMHYSNFQFLVLNHGDFRKDNIMVKYGPHDTVDAVKLIDLQACFWSAPIFDFMYFFFTSTETELIENHYETLLSWYLRCLNEQLRKINCTQTYDRHDFDKDNKSLDFCSMWIIMVTVFLTATRLDELDSGQLAKDMLSGKTEKIQYYTRICLKDEYVTKKISSVCKLCERLGLFEA